MLGKRAKILSDDNIRDLLAFTTLTRYPIRNRVMVLLSVKAGFRAGEIANLTWAMVTDPVGEIGTVIALEDRIAKKKSGRVIPLHPALGDALTALRNGLEDMGL
jgi:integrase